MFPKDLADGTHAAWDRFVAEDLRPPCPPREALTELLEVAAVASAFPEEGRYPRFLLIALPAGDARFRSLWRFAGARAYGVHDLRGLIPATDGQRSAVAAFRPGVELIDVCSEGARRGERLDVEMFGMRHRSAVKLVSQHPEVRVLVVSQDGPISAVWSDPAWGPQVLFRKGINLASADLPWA